LKTREVELAEQAAALQSSEGLNAAIIDCGLAAVITTDQAGRIVEFNPMAGMGGATLVLRLRAGLNAPPDATTRSWAPSRMVLASAAPGKIGRVSERPPSPGRRRLNRPGI
jgi:hypothetical protein